MAAGTSMIDWDLARRVAVKAAGAAPTSSLYPRASLDDDFAEFTELAETLVENETGLRSLNGRAVGRVTDRAGWVGANVSSFQHMLKPLLAKVEPQMKGPLGGVTSKIAAYEVGTLLGFMSKRVLGQYDVLMASDAATSPANPAAASSPAAQPEGDVVYYVGPNVAGIERRFGFDPRQFRLWLAIHEVTHRAQFTGVSWMREHYLGLVEQSLGSFDADPQRLIEAFKHLAASRKEGRSALDDGGLAAVFASAQQREILAKIGGLMSLLEGHGDVTMSRAGKELIPGADRFSRILSYRRQQTTGAAKLIQKLIGLDAKLKQYEQGERFIEAVEKVGGHRVLDKAWRGPEWLPSMVEIRDPNVWLNRVGLCPVPA